MTTNMVPPTVLPLPVQQAAAAQRLGAFQKAYQPTLARTIVSSLVFMAAAVFFCAGGIFPPELTVATRVILLLFGLFFLGATLSLGYSVIQVANQQIYLFEQGMVIDKGKQVQPFLWKQTAAIWQSITRNYRNGRYVGTTYVYTLRRVDGYQIKLDNLTKDIAELGPAIARGITLELVPRALQALETGQTLTFDSFNVNLQGIGNGQQFLPWSQVQEIEVKQGRLTIKQIGTSRPWGTDRVAKIPNFLVFTAVTDEMLRRARRR